MIGKILQSTKGKPCTCPSGKICTACKKKRNIRVKPHVVVEGGSNHLPVPLKITTYKEQSPTTVQLLQRRKHWNPYKKQAPTVSANRGTKICQWYRRRKAINDLKKLTKLEKKRQEKLRIDKAREEREIEFIEQLKQRERELRKAEERLEVQPRRNELYEYREKIPAKYKEVKPEKKTYKEDIYKENKYKEQKYKEKKPKEKTRKEYIPREKTPIEYTPREKTRKEKKRKEKKPIKNTIKASEAKPVAESRYVSVKTRHRYGTRSRKGPLPTAVSRHHTSKGRKISFHWSNAERGSWSSAIALL